MNFIKDIGQNLKDTREKSGVSLEEASKDLNISALILENIEDGNIGCFKDVFLLKEYVKNYAKYLGLDDSKIIDEFNEYLFEYTSRIPLEDIEKAVIEKVKAESKNKEIASPYTKPVLKTKKLYYTLIYLLIIFLIIIAVIWSVKQITINNEIINYVSYL